MQYIRIIAVPPGEAPVEVREQWVGLELPLNEKRGARPTSIGGFGVWSGPKSAFGQIAGLILGKYVRGKHLVVDGATAIRILHEKSPAAAEWWKENASHWLRPGRLLAFAEDVCELLPGVSQDTLPLT
jgi:hypothetical protein